MFSLHEINLYYSIKPDTLEITSLGMESGIWPEATIVFQW